MKIFKLYKSTRSNKKYMVIDDNNNKIHFGGYNNNDFIIYNTIDKKLANSKKDAYLKRHSKLNENWNDYKTPAFWATNLLWNKETLNKSIKDILKRYHIKIENYL